MIAVNHRNPNALSVSDVHRGLGESVFERRDGKSLEEWLNRYSIRELYEMNVLGALP